MEGVDSHNVGSQLVDSVSWDMDLCSGHNVVLVDDAVSEKNSGSVDVEDDDTEGEGADETDSVGVGEGEEHFFLLDIGVGVFEFDSDGLFVGGLDIETLDEGFDFEADGGEVLLERVDHVEGFVAGDQIGGTGEGGVAELHVGAGGGDEVDAETLPLGGVGGVHLELDAGFGGLGVDDLDFHGGGFLAGDFVDSCIPPQVPKEMVGSEAKDSSNW